MQPFLVLKELIKQLVKPTSASLLTVELNNPVGLYRYFYFLFSLGLFPNAWEKLSVLDTPEYHSMSIARECLELNGRAKGRKEVLEDGTSISFMSAGKKKWDYICEGYQAEFPSVNMVKHWKKLPRKHLCCLIPKRF